MKRRLLCTIAMAVLFVAVGFAQDERVDVVYLKDGSVIRGTIIEQIPGQSLKIETRDGSVFALEFSRIMKITKEEAPSTQSMRKSSGSSDTRFVASVLMGGLIYGDFWFATGVRLGASISRIVYVGMTVTTAFGDLTAVYFGGELGFNANIRKITMQPYVSVGLGSIADYSSLALGPGFSLTYGITKDVGIGADGKYMFVPEISDAFGLVYVSFVYQF